jgi:PhzF family phenazine biosynthesis protein
MPLRLYQVDAFTDRPFAGNPAAVCLLDGPAGDGWMQAVAAENNLSETAFLRPGAGGPAHWDLRWFTPTVEVALCGHATLAAAHVLFTEVGVDGDELRFATRSGLLRATRRSGGIEIDLPADTARPVPDPTDVLGALGAGPGPEVWRGAASGMVLAVLDSPAAVRAVQPDLAAVARLDAFGLIVTAAGDGRPSGGERTGHEGGPDVVSRFFAPGAGIDEDPVTGAAHCLLGPFWTHRLGRPVLRAHQASARGGDLLVEVRGDRVALTGAAVTVLAATLSPAAAPD